ncbi:RNA polymerase sigma factor [Sphingomonas sp. GB1N7]|uniref:RNA polymerase sigma factor n=1 Tax=Parasphingomonas caseinilytica TaxID=3096158 RepID=UPI002FC6BE8E
MKWLRHLIGLNCPPEDATDLKRLEYAMFSLSRRDREIFLAVRLDKMTYLDIADVMGLSVKQVERSVARAMVAIDRALS